MGNYKDFLSTKAIKSNASGFTVDKTTLNTHLYEWQRDIVAWALRKGKACLFEDCGLGKTLQQLSFADEPVTHTNESFPVEIWQKYASPIWTDINPSDTLQYKSARENKDEKHICPLQLKVIERGINLWTNPNDIVLTPFLGIGSECYKALEMGRRAIGIELKSSYYEQAVKNCQSVTAVEQLSLW